MNASIKIVSMALLLAAASHSAAETEAARVGELRDAQTKLSRYAERTKGAPRHLLLMEERRIEGLIRNLEAGQPVDPADIDRALERAAQGGL
jgi:hypothetical protein